jgi:cysteine-rich repeat protein
MSPARRRPVAALAVALSCFAAAVFAAAPAWAHGGAQPLETWGAFPPGAAYCQRITASAAAHCALQAARLRLDCLDLVSRGLDCNEAVTEAEIVRARREAQDLVDLHCSNNDASTIGYLDLFELQGDIVRFCREWEDTAASAAYGTVLPGGGPLGSATYECVRATTATVTKLSQLVFDTWRRTLDRIAVRSWNLEAKTSMIDNGNERIAGMESRAAADLPGRCAAGFESVYRRSVATLVGDLVSRANCFAPAFYVQDAILCPTAVCGNWIIEPGETCDDGNVVAGDGCDGTCIADVSAAEAR